MAEILTSVGSVFTAMLGLATETVDFIVATPLVMLPILVGLGFTGVRLFKSIR